MQKHEPLEALRYFRKAVTSDPEFAPVWSNLGALYSRAGYFKYAEAAYIQALAINSQELIAMSNLGRLYESLGQTKQADWYNKQTNLHRMRNPYYRYHLAREAFLVEDYDTAIGHLKYSVKKKVNEDTFYFLMGLSYLQKGNESAARQWLEKAEQVAEDDGLQRNYHSKLEMLLSAQK
ncbi:MAG: tetratricopeptide repeat protein [Planctomycetes bacterium]|nr:tetratricopeptide repeat protein [Planctomycetota bacterium]